MTENNYFWSLVFLGLIFIGFLFLRSYAKRRAEIQRVKEKMAEWRKKSPNEEIFQEKIKIFLEEYPLPKKKSELKRAQTILREVQFFIQDDLFKKGKLSFSLYKKLIFVIEKKRKEFAF